MWRLEQPVYGSQLVDERQCDAESVQRWPRRIREVGSVRERIDVVQILNPACQRHRANTHLTEQYINILLLHPTEHTESVQRFTTAENWHLSHVE